MVIHAELAREIIAHNVRTLAMNEKIAKGTLDCVDLLYSLDRINDTSQSSTRSSLSPPVADARLRDILRHRRRPPGSRSPEPG
jgi:hypothetical protein